MQQAAERYQAEEEIEEDGFDALDLYRERPSAWTPWLAFAFLVGGVYLLDAWVILAKELVERRAEYPGLVALGEVGLTLGPLLCWTLSAGYLLRWVGLMDKYSPVRIVVATVTLVVVIGLVNAIDEGGRAVAEWDHLLFPLTAERNESLLPGLLYDKYGPVMWLAIGGLVLPIVTVSTFFSASLDRVARNLGEAVRARVVRFRESRV
ncbi:MAG: hypothetical protein F4X54_07455 [Chloroflexi bacterium]|nr:hypothetical protein [Chloroflexota bacterium]